jgi:hypothetical protein
MGLVEATFLRDQGVPGMLWVGNNVRSWDLHCIYGSLAWYLAQSYTQLHLGQFSNSQGGDVAKIAQSYMEVLNTMTM